MYLLPRDAVRSCREGQSHWVAEAGSHRGARHQAARGWGGARLGRARSSGQGSDKPNAMGSL